MAKPKFDFTDKHNLLRIEEWAFDGATDKWIAETIGYNEKYFQELKAKNTDLSDALTRGRAPLDRIVENSLFKKTTGFTAKEQRAFKVKREFYDEEGRKCSEEGIEVVEVDVYIPPDVNAQAIWLRNRKVRQWNKEVTKVDHTSNGKDLNPQIQVEIIDRRDQVRNDTDDSHIQ